MDEQRCETNAPPKIWTKKHMVYLVIICESCILANCEIFGKHIIEMHSGDVTPGAVLSMEQPWDLPTLDQVLEWGTLQGASKSKGGWIQLCLYMYLPGVQSSGQETVLGNGMTWVLTHVIPKPKCLNQSKELDLTLLCCNVFCYHQETEIFTLSSSNKLKSTSKNYFNATLQNKPFESIKK
ncbi:hypothetical protein HGM15179_014411 [Zosterops borbonicus]|uniref:Uncharacterized protein n=1 Tax=Zosterops borbonicus TaxID=364589 RepID=A0A8K1G6B6_9PASS|nr:hypothetical protein HGM15179_014411 [Zosterops borbonicus]